MWKFTATYRTNRYPQAPTPITQLQFETGLEFVDHPAERIDISIYTFLLSDAEIARIRVKISDPHLSRLITKADKPAKIVSLYLRQFANQPPNELISVTATPEVLPEELRGAPDLAVNSATFTPHENIPNFWRPGNPQLSDPWTRGW
ncbi:MAG: hypothetical protein HYW90_00480 [Candidatus Sungbacteria bacterium]|nr:hypothetical protein [Candidatus Sungbacteria bacterium]